MASVAITLTRKASLESHSNKLPKKTSAGKMNAPICRIFRYSSNSEEAMLKYNTNRHPPSRRTGKCLGGAQKVAQQILFSIVQSLKGNHEQKRNDDSIRTWLKAVCSEGSENSFSDIWTRAAMTAGSVSKITLNRDIRLKVRNSRAYRWSMTSSRIRKTVPKFSWIWRLPTCPLQAQKCRGLQTLYSPSTSRYSIVDSIYNFR